MTVSRDGLIAVSFADRPFQDLTRVTFRGAALRGQFEGKLTTRKGFDGNPMLTFQLERNGDRLVASFEKSDGVPGDVGPFDYDLMT